LAESSGNNVNEQVIDASVQKYVAALNRGKTSNIFTE